jgi:succinyl-diaminopimelate desuccinylase
MAMSNPQAFRALRGGDSEAVLQLARELIRRPTPNPPGEERALAEYLATDLRLRGLEAQVVPVGNPDSAQANVFARLPGRGLRPPLVLSGHLDTVPPGEGTWSRDPYAPEVEGGRLFGLGASDMKGAVAAMSIAAALLAGETAAGESLAADLILAFTSNEETTSIGAHALARSGLLNGAGGLVIGEPTCNRVGIAEKGGIWLELVLSGRTSHGSLPHLGANAVAGMAQVLAALERAAAGGSGRTGDRGGLAAAEGAVRTSLSADPHPLLGAPSLTPTRIAGGVANNVVPDRATAVLDVRTLPGQSNSAIQRAIAQLLERVAAARGLTAQVISRGERVALATAHDHPLAAACAAAVEATLSAGAEICGLTGATDATELVPPLGVPFVICGPGDMAQAHQPDEFVDVAALAASVEIYYRLARSLCA